MQSKKVGYILLGITIFLITVFNIPVFKPKDWLNISDDQKLSGMELKRALTASIYDYLPIVAKRAPDDIAENKLIVISGVATDEILEKGTNWYRIVIDVKSDTAQIAIPSYNYPVWKVYVDKKEVATYSYGDFGLVSFNVDSGRHSVIAKQTDTLIKTVSNSVSLLSFTAAGIYIVNEKKRNKNIKK